MEVTAADAENADREQMVETGDSDDQADNHYDVENDEAQRFKQNVELHAEIWNSVAEGHIKGLHGLIDIGPLRHDTSIHLPTQLGEYMRLTGKCHQFDSLQTDLAHLEVQFDRGCPKLAQAESVLSGLYEDIGISITVLVVRVRNQIASHGIWLESRAAALCRDVSDCVARASREDLEVETAFAECEEL